ncbi:hypothetical protein HaLaN_08707, partial [Haematococcus lacustris]
MSTRQQVVQQASKKPKGCSAELFVLLHLPIQEGPDGGPILPITVVDSSRIFMIESPLIEHVTVLVNLA